MSKCASTLNISLHPAALDLTTLEWLVEAATGVYNAITDEMWCSTQYVVGTQFATIPRGGSVYQMKDKINAERLSIASIFEVYMQNRSWNPLPLQKNPPQTMFLC